MGWKRNYLMFRVTSQWSSNSGSHDTKDCTLKKKFKKKGLIAYFTSTIKTIYKEEIITENTTVCRNLDTCTRVLALLDKIKSLERGGASVK